VLKVDLSFKEEGEGIKTLSFASEKSQEQGVQPQVPLLYNPSAASFPSGIRSDAAGGAVHKQSQVMVLKC